MFLGRILICLGVAASVTASPTTRRQKQPYKRLIVFGDSLSDNGTGAWILSGKTWPADPAYFHHSFSNGPVWSVTLARTLGVELIDYATGGATTDNSFTQGFTGPRGKLPVPSAYDQIKNFLSTHKPRHDDLFVHWIGANDIFFGIGQKKGSQVVSLISRNVDTLYRAGVKNLVLINLPPIDALPATVGQPVFTKLGVPFAATINQGLVNIAAPYSPWLQIGVVDVKALFTTVVANPEVYGFDEQYVNPATPCLKGTYGTGNRTLCDDPDRHLWWDLYHPTTRAHTLVAKEVQKTLGRLQ